MPIHVLQANEFSIGEVAVDIDGSSSVKFTPDAGGKVRMIVEVLFTPLETGPTGPPLADDCGIFDYRNAGYGFGSADTKLFVRFDPGRTQVYLGVEVLTPAYKGEYGNPINP